MAVTPESFRAAFPEFADPTKYPDALVARKITFAVKLTNAARWGDLHDEGVELYAAHELTLATRKPGNVVGVVTAKKVDKVGANYDAGSVAEEGAGQWNATTYGQRYIRLARMVGAGGMQA
ncbi:MAG TPA: DUF4054 domain-containing protein [Acidimicrobiales bacterium]|nr:DUF4054 domain-containing protein [Acidimicrobiales bacterium]